MKDLPEMTRNPDRPILSEGSSGDDQKPRQTSLSKGSYRNYAINNAASYQGSYNSFYGASTAPTARDAKQDHCSTPQTSTSV